MPTSRNGREETGRRTPQSWAVPVLAVAAGGIYFIAELIAGNPGTGVVLLLIMLAAAAVFVAGSRYSETVRGLLDHRDERITGIDRSASLFAGMVLLLAVLVAFIVSLAQGHNGNPYAWLAGITGLSYIAAVIYLRVRH